MRYAATILYVPDVPAAVAFYTAAFGLEAAFADPSGGHAQLAGEGGVIAFARRDVAAASIGEEANARAAGFEIWIEDVPAAVDRAVKAGAELLVEPVKKPWGQTVAYVRDPNGTLIEIGEPVSPR